MLLLLLLIRICKDNWSRTRKTELSSSPTEPYSSLHDVLRMNDLSSELRTFSFVSTNGPTRLKKMTIIFFRVLYSSSTSSIHYPRFSTQHRMYPGSYDPLSSYSRPIATSALTATLSPLTLWEPDLNGERPLDNPSIASNLTQRS